MVKNINYSTVFFCKIEIPRKKLISYYLKRYNQIQRRILQCILLIYYAFSSSSFCDFNITKIIQKNQVKKKQKKNSRIKKNEIGWYKNILVKKFKCPKVHNCSLSGNDLFIFILSNPRFHWTSFSHFRFTL